MAKLSTLFLCIVILVTGLHLVLCKGGRGGGGHGGRGGSHGGGGHSGGGGWSWGGSSSRTSSGSHTYPSSNTGLSGSGRSGYPSSGHTYPSSNTGLSGTGNKPSYPSGTGLSGYGNSNQPPPYSGSKYNSKNSYNSNSGYRYNSGQQSYGTPGGYYTPSIYYQSPQTVYVTEYRNSNSRYSDILTGLTLYNMGRSESHHHHYYDDDYSRRRYYSSSSTSHNTVPPKTDDAANCTLKIEDTGKVQIIRVPCEIVSTFTETGNNDNITTTEKPLTNVTSTLPGTNITSSLPDVNVSSTDVNSFNASTTNNTGNIDPIKEKGPKLEVTNSMKCTVEIRTKTTYLNQKVNCETLMNYAKMPEPKKPNALVPSRNTLRSWMNSPPWWMSLFIVV